MFGPRADRPGQHPGSTAAGVVAAAAACALLLSGCQSNPAPPPLAKASASPSPTHSPTDSPPTLPAAAKGTSKAAAKAFVRHYIDVLNYAASTGDVALLHDLSSKSCASCSAIIERIEQVYRDGGNIRGAGWSAFNIQAVRGQPRLEPVFEVGVRVSAQELQTAQGKKARHFEGGRQPMIFRLFRMDGWRVRQMEKAQ